MKNKIIFVFLFIILLLIIISCDLEKLSGYNYSYDPPPETAIFTGTVFNRFTFEPVPLAAVNVANQVTYTDENGLYILYYHYNEDDQRNQPVDVRISCENYLNLDTSIIVYPENVLNAYIKYGAPIIKKIALVDTTFFQALVFDYQGFNDIAFVKVQYAYRRDGEKFPSLYAEAQLIRVYTDSLYTSVYQTQVARSIDNFGRLMSEPYSISAEDRWRYKDFMTSMEGGTDTSLIPITLP